MDKTARRILIATSLGAMAGAWVALLLPVIVWWLGALLGGLVSGIIFSLPKIIRYAPSAARTAWQDLTYLPKIGQAAASLTKAIWQAPAEKKWGAAPFVIFTASFALTFSAMLYLHLHPRWVLLFAVYLFYTEIVWGWSIGKRVSEDNREEKLKIAKRAVFLQSPVGFTYLLHLASRYLCNGAIKMLILAWEGKRFLAVFAKELFFYIHSRELLLCMVDAGLAVCIAYVFFARMAGMATGPTVLMAGLTGALLGTVNYQLVSKRWLKLA